MKHTLAALLLLSMLASFAGPVFAGEAPVDAGAAAAAPQVNAGQAPHPPVSPVPADGATSVRPFPDGDVSLQATVGDPDEDLLTVSFYGRPHCESPNFTLVVLPDTQYYCSETHGATRAMFDAQVEWIVDNRAARNIVYVTHVGDIVDGPEDAAQWDIAGKLTDPMGALTTLEQAGIEYGLAVGNHDGAPNLTTLFNVYFPPTRMGDGHYGSDNDNNYGLFSAEGLDFIVIHIEFHALFVVRDWARTLLQTYPSHRAIVVTHYLLDGTTTPAPFSPEGELVYNILKPYSNLFLMLGGHLDTEVSRTDTYEGRTVYSLRSDYQTRSGGNGWLRLIEFRPARNQIQVYTYSPYLDEWETDADSQFTLAYDMTGAGCAPFELIQTVTDVPSGSSPAVMWAGRSLDSRYDWTVTVSDGTNEVTGPVWTFTTAASFADTFMRFLPVVEKQAIALDGRRPVR